MESNEIDLDEVTHITTDAIGPPGKRVFYIQAWQGDRTLSFIVEKIQIQSLSVGYEQFLVELHKRYPHLPEASGDYKEEAMHIYPPVDPLFRVGEMGLGYDESRDRVVLMVREVVSEEGESPEARVVRLWCTRGQLRAMCRWGIEVASRGRPICPQCGEPIDPEGHFCPKRNGHKH